MMHMASSMFVPSFMLLSQSARFPLFLAIIHWTNYDDDDGDDDDDDMIPRCFGDHTYRGARRMTVYNYG